MTFGEEENPSKSRTMMRKKSYQQKMQNNVETYRISRPSGTLILNLEKRKKNTLSYLILLSSYARPVLGFSNSV